MKPLPAFLIALLGDQIYGINEKQAAYKQPLIVFVWWPQYPTIPSPIPARPNPPARAAADLCCFE